MQKNGSDHPSKVRAKSSELLSFEIRGSRIRKPLSLEHGTKSNFYQMNVFDLEKEEQEYKKSKSATQERSYPKGPPTGTNNRSAIKLNICDVDSKQVKTEKLQQLEEALELKDFKRLLQKDFSPPEKCFCRKETGQQDLCQVVGASKFYKDNYKVYYDLLKYLVVRSHRPKNLD